MIQRRKIIAVFVCVLGLLFSVYPKGVFAIQGVSTLCWDRNTDADYYVVYIREKGTADFVVAPGGQDITGTEFIIPPMQGPDTVYEFSVKAFNVYGNSSDFSDSVEYVQNAHTKPGTPVNINIKTVYTISVQGALN